MKTAQRSMWLFFLAASVRALLLLAIAKAATAPPATHPQARRIGNLEPGVLAVATVTPTLTPTGWLPALMHGWCPPAIEITQLPPYVSTQDRQGRVT